MFFVVKWSKEDTQKINRYFEKWVTAGEGNKGDLPSK